MTVLSGENVTKEFGGLTAVDTVDFEIQRGEIVGLIGPNGAGKSTLFDCITGVHDVDEGRIMFDDDDITDRSEHRIAQSGVIRLFQDVRVYQGMTLYDNMLVSVNHGTEDVADIFRQYDETAHQRAEELLREVDLWSMRGEEAGTLSYGQQKLLEFSMTLMADPDLLLLDEPVGGINPTMIQTVLAYIRDINEQREKTLFVIEHNMDVIMDISQRIYVMSNGEILAEGDPATIQSSERVKQAYLGGSNE